MILQVVNSLLCGVFHQKWAKSPLAYMYTLLCMDSHTCGVYLLEIVVEPYLQCTVGRLSQ
jgi:hypothetical protein